jgi:flagellin-like hook-associated protein FlgL
MASNITLSAGVRANLLSLQHTAGLMSTTQTRLATGKKVNTALDNPVNFFTASSLQSRSSDLSALLDSMSNGIKTLEAADNGLTSITSTLQSMKSTLQQARQDKSFQTESYTIDSTTIGTASLKNLSFSGGAVGSTLVNIALNVADVAATPGSATSGTVPGTYTGGTLSINGTDVTIADDTNAAGLKSAIDGASIAGITTSVSGSTITISNASGNVDFTGSTGALLTTRGLSTSSNYVAGVPGSVKSVDALVAAINSSSSLTGKVSASNDGGKLRIQNLSTADLTVTGASNTTSAIDGSASTDTIKGNDVRKSLVTQYNDLKDQLDKFADDASFNGINLLRGDNLKITFNETATSTISIQAKTTAGAATAIDSAYLGISTLANSSVDSDTNIDSLTANLGTALNSVRSQSSTFGSSLSIVQNRQDFTKAMINTLQTGADNLTLADTNEEAANMLALQTRQQLSQTALSLASQADQAVLRLF